MVSILDYRMKRQYRDAPFASSGAQIVFLMDGLMESHRHNLYGIHLFFLLTSPPWIVYVPYSFAGSYSSHRLAGKMCLFRSYQRLSTTLPGCDSSFSTRLSSGPNLTSSWTSKWKRGPDLPRALVTILSRRAWELCMCSEYLIEGILLLDQLTSHKKSNHAESSSLPSQTRERLMPHLPIL